MYPHYCHWLWHTITVLCDGNVTCGLDDPFGVRSYGNVNGQRIFDILKDKRRRRRRKDLLDGILCRACCLFAPFDSAPDGQKEPSQVPGHLIIEPTVKCNLRCPQPACIPNNNPAVRTRAKDFMSFETYRKIIDELGVHLGLIYFFNYGEPFLHPRSGDMLLYTREKCPEVRIETSTNGIYLSNSSLAEQVVKAGVDKITFTIGGATQQSYERYHVGGRLKLALQGMANIVHLKRRIGSDKPEVCWRYLTFRWNDSEEETALAQSLAAQIGVDSLRFHLTHCPTGAVSERLAPGQPGHERLKDRIDYAFDYVHIAPDAHGLYGWEHHERLGPFRWAKKTCRLSLSHGQLVRMARPHSGPKDDPPFVDVQTPWATTRWKVGLDDWQEHRFRIPKNMRQNGQKSVEVELHFDRGFCPESAGIDDPRELGAMLQIGRAPESSVDAQRFEAESFVSRFYPICLLRDPDPAGMNAWISALLEGSLTGADVARGFVLGGELEATELADEAFLEILYQALFDGQPDSCQYEFWLDRLKHQARRADVFDAFIYSRTFADLCDEYDIVPFARTEPLEFFVGRLYRICLGREPDPEGLSYWVDSLLDGACNGSVVARGFVCGEEFVNRETSDEQFVAILYRVFFNREPDSGGYSNWMATLAGGESREDVLKGFIYADEFYNLCDKYGITAD